MENSSDAPATENALVFPHTATVLKPHLQLNLTLVPARSLAIQVCFVGAAHLALLRRYRGTLRGKGEQIPLSPTQAICVLATDIPPRTYLSTFRWQSLLMPVQSQSEEYYGVHSMSC